MRPDKSNAKTRVLAVLAILSSSVFAQQPQVPFLTVTTLRSGTVISTEDSTRVLGYNIDSSRHFQTTDGIAAIRIQLRTLGQVKSPYEVQCFFCARSPRKVRYVYDAVKLLSEKPFDEVIVAARDLFSGSETTDTTNLYQTLYGPGTYATALTIITDKKIIPGSTVEGWIVRVLSGEKIVRTEASLQELKTFAENESKFLDQVAASRKEEE